MTLAITRTAEAADDWPPCPSWCTTCLGGETRSGLMLDRVHEGTLLQLPVDGADGHGPITLSLIAQRIDIATLIGTPTVMLRLEGTHRPNNLTGPQIDRELRGMNPGMRDNLLAHYLAGAFTTVACQISDGTAGQLLAALAQPVE